MKIPEKKVDVLRCPRTGEYLYLTKGENERFSLRDHTGRLLILDTKDYFDRNFVYVNTVTL